MAQRNEQRKRRNRLLGLALLLAGLGSSMYGYVQYQNAGNAVGVALREVFDAPTPELSQAVAVILAGLVVAAVGAVLLIRRK